MAEALEDSGDYRVLRRLDVRTLLVEPEDDEESRIGLYVDTETTGLDTATDEVIELAAVPFAYAPSGRGIFKVYPPLQGFRDPGRPIPTIVTEITGITDEMVRGQTLDLARLQELLSAHKPAPIVAHNAGFDRKMLERICPAFAELPWACSSEQVDWRAEGYGGRSLEHLAMSAGYFYDAHRAVDDCMAGIAMLALPLPKSGIPALTKLLERGRQVDYRIWAERSPFSTKDALKARGYRWHDDRKCWAVDVIATLKTSPEMELEWLKQAVYGGRSVELPVHKITAYDRFSVRV